MAHLTNFSLEFFYEIFTEYASLLFLYHGAKKSKMTKNSNQGGGGSCLNTSLRLPVGSAMGIFGVVELVVCIMIVAFGLLAKKKKYKTWGSFDLTTVTQLFWQKPTYTMGRVPAIHVTISFMNKSNDQCVIVGFIHETDSYTNLRKLCPLCVPALPRSDAQV